jgi:hypothetical protein
MVRIIRPVEVSDLNKGFKDMYKEKLDENSFNQLIQKHSISYALFDTKLNMLYAVIFSNIIKITGNEIYCYSLHYKKKNKENFYKVLVNHFTTKTRGKYFFRALNEIDFENHKFTEFVKENNLQKIKRQKDDTFVLHSVGLDNYISVRTVDKFKLVGKNDKTTFIVADVVNVNPTKDTIMEQIMCALYPIKVRQLEKADGERGLEQILVQLNKSKNVTKLNPEKCKEYIQKMMEELGNTAKVYVMIHSNNVIGTATIYYQPKLHRQSQNIEYAAFIEDVVVDKSYKGMRLGNFFVNYLIKKSRLPDIESIQGYKIYKVSLNCSKDLCRFYEKSNLLKTGAQMTQYF